MAGKSRRWQFIMNVATLRMGKALRHQCRKQLLQRSFGVEVGTSIPIAILKEQKDPVILEEHEYPEFVSSLKTPQPNLQQLEAQVKESGLAGMDLALAKRASKLRRRKIIKDNNDFE